MKALQLTRLRRNCVRTERHHNSKMTRAQIWGRAMKDPWRRRRAVPQRLPARGVHDSPRLLASTFLSQSLATVAHPVFNRQGKTTFWARVHISPARHPARHEKRTRLVRASLENGCWPGFGPLKSSLQVRRKTCQLDVDKRTRSSKEWAMLVHRNRAIAGSPCNRPRPAYRRVQWRSRPQ